MFSRLELNKERNDKITIVVVKNNAINPIQIENSPNILQNLRGREIFSNIFCPLLVLIIKINPRTFVAFHFSRYPSFSSILIKNMLIKSTPSNTLSEKIAIIDKTKKIQSLIVSVIITVRAEKTRSLNVRLNGIFLDVACLLRHLNPPLFCYRWFHDVMVPRNNMNEDNSATPSTRRKIDSMVRDLDSIVRLLQQASLEEVQLDIIEIKNRITLMEDQLLSPSVSINE